jgi:hypothetical protein
MPSGQKLTLDLLAAAAAAAAAATFQAAHFRAYASFPVLLPFLNSSCKFCSLRAFSTAYDSASITQIV